MAPYRPRPPFQAPRYDAAVTPDASQLGPNAWLVEELYERWSANPAAVAPEWRELFERESGETQARLEADRGPELPAPPQQEPEQLAEPGEPASVPAPPQQEPEQPAEPGEPASVPTPAQEPERPAEPGEPIRGARARIVENMVASLGVPTATSYRRVPARLLEVNRKVINGYLGRTGQGKVSFTHIIASAVVEAVATVPAMGNTYATDSEGRPRLVHHPHVGLGLAVDVERADGSRSLLVPCIAEADTLEFKDFHAAYEQLIAKVNENRITPDDFAGTTLSLTNVGTIGTVQSVPRLMPGQSTIVGVGALDYPAEFHGADPATMADLGLSKVVTISSTYDHRIIQGAESGLFLRRIHDLLLGADDFYDRIFQSLDVPYSAVRWHRDVNPVDHDASQLLKQMQVRKIVQMYRVRGHLIADLDPLAVAPRSMHAELDPATYGLTIWDLDREFLTDDVPTADRMLFGDLLGVLRDAYSRTIGVEYMHIQDPEEKTWIQEQVEMPKHPFSTEDQRFIFECLSRAEAFEGFLDKRFVGHKRFGLEGGESAIAILNAIFEQAADEGMAAAVMGMAHRGRLNVLAHVMGESYERMFQQFEGYVDPETIQGTGDVKYHLGATTTYQSRAGNSIDLTLAANPSHLEAVDPVVLGIARAKQDKLTDQQSYGVLPVLVHGDAAFAGQGVVAETLELSQLDGYTVGGAVHVVINNQLGYTTTPEQSRSSPYPTDIAKAVQAPIFHVNGDDPEACVRVARWAFAYRQAFHKDVVIDMFCYRRHGHNEGDDPSYTQPLMYERITSHPPVREKYVATLLDRGDITPTDAEAAMAVHQKRLQEVLDATRAAAPPVPARARPKIPYLCDFTPVASGVARDVLDRIFQALYAWPEDFTVHPKLARQFENRRALYEGGEVDWGLAETLAYGSLLLDGRTVRLIGQDTRRGTFAHRHAALIDYVDQREFIPLAQLADDQGHFWVHDSLLSEYAAVGVEYGYSIEDREGLVAWEAQFGDFVNGAQIIIDQFVAAGAEKWDQASGLVLLLPHGYEGQGPEHSSARIERFLILCAEGNMTVANASTSSQFFHLLRRQVHTGNPRPLIVFTPKSLLRARQSRSAISQLVDGHFREVLDDPGVDDPESVTTVVLCSGKVAYDAMERRDTADLPIAVVRVEQLYPWPDIPLAQLVDAYPEVRRLVWLQEEPANMGAWQFVKARAALPDLPLLVVARPESGSPAGGSASVHAQEHEQLMIDLEKSTQL